MKIFEKKCPQCGRGIWGETDKEALWILEVHMSIGCLREMQRSAILKEFLEALDTKNGKVEKENPNSRNSGQ